jgi:hypothetical protein
MSFSPLLVLGGVGVCEAGLKCAGTTAGDFWLILLLKHKSMHDILTFVKQ